MSETEKKLPEINKAHEAFAVFLGGLKTVTSQDGKLFVVDTSDEACSEFGFKHGDRIVDKDIGNGTIVGVALSEAWDGSGIKVLWYEVDVAKGFVGHRDPLEEGDLTPLKEDFI